MYTVATCHPRVLHWVTRFTWLIQIHENRQREPMSPNVDPRTTKPRLTANKYWSYSDEEAYFESILVTLSFGNLPLVIDAMLNGNSWQVVKQGKKYVITIMLLYFVFILNMTYFYAIHTYTHIYHIYIYRCVYIYIIYIYVWNRVCVER